MARYGLFGDSYIKRLQRFWDGDLHVPGSSKFVHRGGLRCDRLNEVMKEKKNESRSHENTSSSSPSAETTSDPEDIFNSICDLVKEFQDIRVCRVYISESYPELTSPKVTHQGLLSQNSTGTKKK